jgi:hypothetical protein
MHRIQFIELHEQRWFPASLRDEVTDALQCGLSLLRAYAPVLPMLGTLLAATGTPRIVDICSGGGGPWLELFLALRGSGVTQITLTDKYPNLRAFESVSAASGNHVKFCPDSVDAMKVPRELTGVRTIFSSFHHFPPDVAAAILQDAVEAGQPIGVFEITRRAPSAIALMLPWSLLAFLYTPLIRPFRCSRLLWTYVVPLIPVVLLFDGVVSCLRSYHSQEMLEIARKLTGTEYDWCAGEISEAAVGIPITYLTGSPRVRR